ncbi:hypothetical protein IQ285_12945 [Burkholderia sp. R-69608]|uniref:hypothetical protein n=1 Tax=Paraburkholderia nemoris TaxID=2793076 RepID=UPI001912E4B7|nr:hypothetical protein [Paraburkholderia nemoris]MBK5148589.1 hypothetical protein [Burkholderia sp. R-69608]
MHLESLPEVVSHVITRAIGDEEIDQELAAFICEDFHSSREPSSYEVRAKELLLHEEVADDEYCVVVALPGCLSDSFPATDDMPDAVVENTPRGRFACVRLRGKRVSVPTHIFRYSTKSRFLILYMFDDVMQLDIVPNTEELEEDFWIHEMCSQSHAHPTYEELEAEFGPADNDGSELPVIVTINRMVKARQ